MDDIIQLNSYPLKTTLGLLVKDKATKKNIVWATDGYTQFGELFEQSSQITVGALTGYDLVEIQPRIRKAAEKQQERTRSHAEVFTPSWICNKMNNYCDEEWFGRKDVFNIEKEQIWKTVTDKIEFPDKKDWKQYVDSRRLEITCGEAPYIVSRYDTSTGEMIDIEKRIGILDRKLRVVGENTETEGEWLKWTTRAFQSVYGYEYQGDNLLIGRINLLMTFVDYLDDKFHREPTVQELKSIANIISWNLWQMDGLKGTPPEKPKEENIQLSLIDIFEDTPQDTQTVQCKINNWRDKSSLEYNSLKGGKRAMKFDFVIGNPPYQDDKDTNNRQPPVYNLFMESAYKIADVVEMITPARYLFNAGQTPKAWNEQMLNDEHFKVLHFEKDGSKIFQNTDIKGGVSITIRNAKKKYGKIGVFTTEETLNSIITKVSPCNEHVLSEIAFPKSNYGFTEQLYIEFPEYKSRLTRGNEYIIDANIFKKIPEIFVACDALNHVLVHGRENNDRTSKYVKKEYIKNSVGLDKFKVFVTGANGAGKFGETLSTPFVAKPNEIHTQTYMSFGAFITEEEAYACLQYIKTKFARCMLDILKVTQNNPRDTWSKIPLQDFTENSDIDWSKPIAEIDKQLYKKYNLSDEEISFIETHVKEMQ